MAALQPGSARQVGNDNCVRWQGRVLQIPPSPLRPHFVRSTVRLHAYPDGTVCFYRFQTWHRLVSCSGFALVDHYFRPPDKPRHQQPWLATLWRKPASPNQPSGS